MEGLAHDGACGGGVVVGCGADEAGEPQVAACAQVEVVLGAACHGEVAHHGTVEVTFEFPGTEWAGHELVAFETVSRDGRDVVVHADIEDSDQAVNIPSIGTTLTDESGEKTPASTGAITLVDTVAYESLVPGRTYTVIGELHDKETGESLGITAEAELTPEEADGEVEVEFAIGDASFLAGRTVVAFETLEHEGREVAIHADIEDEAQAISFPEIRTTAVGGNGTKRILVGSSVTVTDTVEYTNLMPGLTYTMRREIHLRNADGTDGGVLTVGGKAVIAEATFTPTETNGTVEMAFTFDASAIAGRSLVVFEGCYEVGPDDEELVAVHSDITDLGQTVEVYSIPVTGDVTNLSNVALFGVAGASISAIGFFLGKRREEDME